jgi:hypothetical protein
VDSERRADTMARRTKKASRKSETPKNTPKVEKKLSRASLYQYLHVYEWVARKHAEWLQPGHTSCRSMRICDAEMSSRDHRSGNVFHRSPAC